MAAAFDEMNGPDGDLRPGLPGALPVAQGDAAGRVGISSTGSGSLLFRRIGITFAVYGDAEAQERLISLRCDSADYFGKKNGRSSKEA